MLKKLSVYTILIIISGSMTACSNNQPIKKVTKATTPTIQRKPAQAVSPDIVQRQVQVTRPKQTPTTLKRRTPNIQRQVAPPRRSYTARRKYSPPKSAYRRPRPQAPRQAYRRPQAPRQAYRRPQPARQTYRRPQAPRSSFANNLSSAAIGRLRSRVRYDGSYVKIAYPWGDVPANTGVCTDVVIRSYRRLGIDLQQQVHNDMSYAFSSYPNVRKWNLTKPDANIDHRRVYNLKAFFTRRGAALPVTHNPHHYKPGDLVTWMVGKDLPHIGVVVNKRSQADPNRFMIVHNIANGPEIDDVLFRFPITGHYRYTPAKMRNIPKANYATRSRSQRPASRKSSGSMNYAQLVAAAKRLGAQPKRKTNTKKKIKKFSPIALANLTNREMQAILKR